MSQSVLEINFSRTGWIGITLEDEYVFPSSAQPYGDLEIEADNSHKDWFDAEWYRRYVVEEQEVPIGTGEFAPRDLR